MDIIEMGKWYILAAMIITLAVFSKKSSKKKKTYTCICGRGGFITLGAWRHLIFNILMLLPVSGVVYFLIYLGLQKNDLYLVGFMIIAPVTAISAVITIYLFRMRRSGHSIGCGLLAAIMAIPFTSSWSGLEIDAEKKS